MFINNALAQAATEAATSNQDISFSSFVPLILIFIVFYFFIIRPQSKKMKEHQAMVGNLKIGNKVITNSGILGVVKAIHEQEGQIELEIADSVNIKILKSYISDVVDADKKTKNK